jgi:DNA-directed RNA polymerase subunit L
MQWLTVTKKVNNPDKASERYAELQREFNTMQIKRCFKINQKGEPFSFDFTVESVGVLDVKYIVNRACEVAENMCGKYVNLHEGDLPDEITLTSADARVIGFDFLFRGHDHTLGNLLQTWLVEHHIEGEAKPAITYAGYSVPHPLRDEMVLRIGVKDGKEATARAAVAAAARGCAGWFQQLRGAWNMGTGKPLGVESVARKNVRVAPQSQPRIG